MTEPPADQRRAYAGTTTEAVVSNVRDAPAIIRRYWPVSVALAVVAGGVAWWVAGDVVAGVVAALLCFLGAFVLGWELEPFLPPDRQVIRPRR
jgi:hypothetical protein